MSTTLRRGLYAITDCENLSWEETLARTGMILRSGVSALQYRNKSGETRDLLPQASALRALCETYATPFIVNDSIDLALASGADGVHLGMDDAPIGEALERLGPDAIIGVSCYDSVDRARAAVSSGATYVAFGAFFATRTKQPRSRASVDLLKEAHASLEVPVAAIGGIDPTNAPLLLAAGADLLAVVSALYRAKRPDAVVSAFNTMFGQCAETGRENRAS